MQNEPSSNGNNGYPRLRPLDIRHETQNGQPCILLRDPLQLSEQMLLVPQPWASVLAFCDGHHDSAAMAAAFTQQFQLPIEPDMVDELLATLDEIYLLDNDRSSQAIQQVLNAYRTAPFREPMLADAGYPADPTELHALFQDYLEDASTEPIPLSAWPQRVGLLSPHIDYPRGGAVYAGVWKAAAEAVKAADLVVIFGTDHYGDDPFTLTRQNYATPYGVLPTEQTIVDALAEIIGEKAAFAGELRHRDEHSLELVAVWLHHMRGGEPVDVVPILTGSLRQHHHNGSFTDVQATLEELLVKLDGVAQGRRVLVIASGDLAHVGPAFGGSPLDEQARQTVREADEALIASMQAGDSAGFLNLINGIDNRHNVCGVSPIYLTMRLVEQKGLEVSDSQLAGKQFGYAICPADEHETSVVTVAGMIFTDGNDHHNDNG